MKHISNIGLGRSEKVKLWLVFCIVSIFAVLTSKRNKNMFLDVEAADADEEEEEEEEEEDYYQDQERFDEDARHFSKGFILRT